MQYALPRGYLPIGSILVAMKILSRSDVSASLLVQRRRQPRQRLGTILVHLGLLSDVDLERALRLQQNLRYRARKEQIRAVFPVGS